MPDHQQSSRGDGGKRSHNELSPLLVGQVSTVSSFSEQAARSDSSGSEEHGHGHDHEQQQQQQRGRANMTRTVVNLMKACLGTGCLALPYACQQGGIITYVIMLVAVAAWCVCSVQRLILCLHYLPDYTTGSESGGQDEESKEASSGIVTALSNLTSPATQLPPDSISTLGKVAWHAFGKAGSECIDIMMVVCLMGILVSYLVATIGFLADTFVSGGGRFFNAFIVSTVMFILSLVPDLGYLSRASLVGLVLLAVTFVIITGYGIYDYSNREDLVHDNDDTATFTTTASLALWPVSETGFSRMYGVCIFAYGFVPLTYNFHDSMRQPERLVSATICASGGVTFVNALIGIGLYMLFPHVTGEVLHELPSTGILPTTIRLAMAVVAIMTAPLLIVPMGELLEGKWQVGANGRWKVRFGVCLVSVAIAVLFPSFVHVLSFVGCAFVGLVSFCVPPILLLRLRYLKQRHHQQVMVAGAMTRTTTATRTIISKAATLWTNFGLDAMMCVAGLLATIAGTIFVVVDS